MLDLFQIRSAIFVLSFQLEREIISSFNVSNICYEWRIQPKPGESRDRAPGQASNHALRAPNTLDSSTMTRCFTKISGPLTSPGPRDPPPAPPSLAGLDPARQFGPAM